LLTLHHYLSPKNSLDELLRGVREEMPINPRHITQRNRGIVPHAFGVIALKMLAKDPAERFQSTDELLAALDDAIEGRPECYWECPPAVTDHVLGRVRAALWSNAGDFANLLYWLAGALMLYGAYRLVREPGWFILWWVLAIVVALLVWTLAGNGRPTIARLKGNLAKGFTPQPNIMGIQNKKGGNAARR
jgi:hypothetical protein